MITKFKTTKIPSLDTKFVVATLLKKKNKAVEKRIFNEMYELYRHSKEYNEFYFISQREFEKFLKWGLPKWKEIKGN